MNMLNKQIITIATASLLSLAAAHIAFTKKPAGGGGNHMQRGIELAQQKHFDEAAAEFTKAIQANPKDPRGYANRGTAYRQAARAAVAAGDQEGASTRDRKSTRLNSSHSQISYAVFCLKKKKTKMKLDNQKEIDEMQNEPQKENASIQYATAG